MKKPFLCLFLSLVAFVAASASTDEIYRNYIEQYAPMAVEQMRLHHIPASITLAQGLLESAAGRSTLAREANNHFGIKCGGNWEGPTALRDDDAPMECFRAYENAAQSYADHSAFLLKRRYERLFDLDPADYRGWAEGLSACGYATDPQYAQRLITIIERYALTTYDLGGEVLAGEMADFIFSTLRNSHPVRRYRGLHYVIANPGDTYTSIASELGMNAAVLAAYNDAADTMTEIRPWQEVYLQEKLTTPPSDVATAMIGQDETLHSVAQRYGMKTAVIKELNPGKTFKPGTKLRLK